MELIEDDNDRLFLTSLGHWTGDAVWSMDPKNYFYGVAEMILPIGAPTKKMRLTYPYIKIRPGINNILYFNFINWDWNDETICTVRISDGVQAIELTETIPQYDHWIWVMEQMNIPKNWIKTKTYLEIEASAKPDKDSLIEFTNFSFETFPTPKIQYLPIVGVG